mgnify:CR=1 FL=1
MKNLRSKADEFVLLATLLGPWTCLVALVLIIGLARTCIPDGTDPIDNSINKSVQVLEHLYVRDSRGNGFRVVYATSHAVTDGRFEEIRSRPAIRKAFGRLQRDAVARYNDDMLDVDICEFALFARRYDVDADITIHNIFVCGREKMNLYVRPNPGMPGGATWMNMETEQGNQYLNATDVNYRIPAGGRIYRYWKCGFLNEVSDTDERFTHFTEEERLW